MVPASVDWLLLRLWHGMLLVVVILISSSSVVAVIAIVGSAPAVLSVEGVRHHLALTAFSHSRDTKVLLSSVSQCRCMHRWSEGQDTPFSSLFFAPLRHVAICRSHSFLSLSSLDGLNSRCQGDEWNAGIPFLSISFSLFRIDKLIPGRIFQKRARLIFQ